MAQSGRKPKPAALADLHGNPGKRARRKPAVAGRGVELRPPAVLRQLAGAVAWWDALVAAMHPALRVPAAVPQLSSLAMMLALRDRAARQLSGGKILVKRDGMLVVAAAFHAFAKAAELARKHSNDLAICPTELARLGLDAPPPRAEEDDDAPARGEDDIDTFLAMHPDRVLQ
jgi:hypothetical protein